jgi:hypothetical protein
MAVEGIEVAFKVVISSVGDDGLLRTYKLKIVGSEVEAGEPLRCKAFIVVGEQL